MSNKIKSEVSTARKRVRVTPRAARLSPAERRQRLLDCAIETFAELGFVAATHAAIAARAGVSVPTVFVYLSSREALIHAVLDEVEGFYRQTLTRASKGRKPADLALIDMTASLTHTLGTHANYARILREWSVSVHDPVWPRYLQHYRRMIRGLTGVIARGQREGSIRSDVNASDEAVLLYAGSTVLIQMMETGESPERLDKVLRSILQTVLLPHSSALRSMAIDGGRS